MEASFKMNLLIKYNHIIIILVFFMSLYLSYSSYNTTKEIIHSKHAARNELVERIIISTLTNANGAYSISEKTLNYEMEHYSQVLLEEYQNNPDIMSWDLDKLKNQMEDYDIYVIDQSLKIINTTFDPDYGMDFTRFKSFAKLLKERLAGTEFVADKMDISTNTGMMKKYSYMPTPDHKYLLELSINIMERYPVLKDFNVFSLASELVEKYQSVDSISFYKFNKEVSAIGLIKTKKTPINTDVPEFNKVLVREAIQANSARSVTFNEENVTITHKYIPFLANDNENDWWDSYVVGVAYNNKELLNEIKQLTNSFLINISIIASVFITFIVIMIYLLKKTEYMAYHDYLTDLANRKELDRYFKSVIRKTRTRHAIFYIDMDNFKQVNDSFGHELGDRLLKELGNRLKEVVRVRDKVARVGGDEFVILLTDINSNGDIPRIKEKLENSISKPVYLDGNIITVNCSIGASIYPDQGNTLEELIKKADIYMYEEKNAGT